MVKLFTKKSMNACPRDGLELKHAGDFLIFLNNEIYIITACYGMHRFIMPLIADLKQPSSVFYLSTGKVFAQLLDLIAAYLFGP